MPMLHTTLLLGPWSCRYRSTSTGAVKGRKRHSGGMGIATAHEDGEMNATWSGLDLEGRMMHAMRTPGEG